MILRAIFATSCIALPLSCAKPKPPAELEPQPIARQTEPTAVDPASLPPRKLEDIGAIGCKLGTHGSVDETAEMVLSKNVSPTSTEPARFVVRYNSATLTLPVGDGAQVLASFESYGSRLSGFVARDALNLGLRASHKLLDGMVSVTDLPHAVLSADAGALHVRIPRIQGVTLSEKASNETIPCDDLASAPFDVLPRTDGHEVGLDIKAALSVSAVPGGPPLLTILEDPKGVLIGTKLDAHDQSVRVEIPMEDAVVTGWIPKSATHPAPKHEAETRGPGKPHEPQPPKSLGLECRAPVDLAAPDHVGSGAALVWIGEIHAGTIVIVDDAKGAPPDPSWRVITLRGVTSNVPILVKNESLETCAKRL